MRTLVKGRPSARKARKADVFETNQKGSKRGEAWVIQARGLGGSRVLDVIGVTPGVMNAAVAPGPMMQMTVAACR